MASLRASRARSATRKAALFMALPSETCFLALVRELAMRMADLGGFDEGTAGKLALAVDEAASNVIEHAYGGAGDREFEVRFEHRGADFRVEVIDTGVMVDPRSFPSVDLERYRAERRKGGLGVHLMEKIMDSVTYRRTSRRNVCCLVKRKDAGDAGPA